MRCSLLPVVFILATTGCNLFEATQVADPPASDAGVDATLPDAGRDVGSVADQGAPDAGISDDADVPDAATVDMVTDPDMSIDGGGEDMSVSTCGNGIVDATEDCEPGLGEMTCTGLGYEGGSLACDPDTCTWDESACHDCDYYFAPESGADANTGDAPAQAWQSLDRFESLLSGSSGANAGEVICIRRGEEWYLERGAAVSRSGALGAPIVVGDYGDSAAVPPLLTVSTPLPAAGWTDLGGGIYSHPLAEINQVLARIWHGDTELSSTASDETLVDGQTFWDGSTVYIKLGGGLSETVWVASDDETFDIRGGARHLEFRNLHFSHGEHAIELHSDASPVGDIRVLACSFDHFDDGIRTYADGSDVVNVTVERSSFSTCGNGVFSSADPGRVSQGFRLINNTGRDAIRDGGSIFYLRNPRESEVSGNDLRSAGGRGDAAIVFEAAGSGSTVQNVVVSHNYIEGHEHGVLMISSAGADPRTVETTIVNNITVGQSREGIRVETCDVNGTSLIAHNTIVSAGDDSLQLTRDCSWKVFNNLSANPVEDHIDEFPHPAGVPVTANEYDYNVFASAIPQFERETTPLTFLQWQALGYDLNSATVLTAQFVGPIPNEPSDYLIAAGFEAVDFGIDVDITQDFGGRVRPAGAAVDVGAWERQATD